MAPRSIVLTAVLLVTTAIQCSILKNTNRNSARPIFEDHSQAAKTTLWREPTWLTINGSNELYGRLSPDGTQLVYASDQSGSFDIWVTDLQSRTNKQLTADYARQEHPSWSPDGARIVFINRKEDILGDIAIWHDGHIRNFPSPQRAAQFPVFSADGAAIYFVQDEQATSRVTKLDIRTGTTTPIAEYGSTHPTMSPDGQYLAYTQFSGRHQSTIVIRNIIDGMQRQVPTTPYLCGFPSFSSDGKWLYFNRFYRGSPNTSRTDDDILSIWRISVAAVMNNHSDVTAEQITSDDQTAIYPHAHPRGLAYTTKRANHYDIALLPLTGPVATSDSASQQLDSALLQIDPWRRLLALNRVSVHRQQDRTDVANYYQATLLRELGEYDKASFVLATLSSVSSTAAIKFKATIDQLLLPYERNTKAPHDSVAFAHTLDALGKLPTLTDPTVINYRQLRYGDLYRYADKQTEALSAYQQVTGELATLAGLRIAALAPTLQEPRTRAHYFLSLCMTKMTTDDSCRKAMSAALQLLTDLKGNVQLQRQLVNELIDAYPKLIAWRLRARLFIAARYQQARQWPLALEQLQLNINEHVTITTDVYSSSLITESRQQLGEIAYEYSIQLKKMGRANDALTYYQQALLAYTALLKSHNPQSTTHQTTLQRYMRLALLEIEQLIQQREFSLAQQRCRQALDVSPYNTALIRHDIAIANQSKRLREVSQQYLLLSQKWPKIAAYHYAVGLLATYEAPLSTQALDTAEKHIRRAITIDPTLAHPHLTLGWILEMREKFFRQSRKGHIENAIASYERAQAQNDQVYDLQTATDAAHNLCNVYAYLGNGWRQAYHYCGVRAKLNGTFQSPLSQLHFLYVYGRAAASANQYTHAQSLFQQAVDLASAERQSALIPEITARMALVAQAQNEYPQAIRLYKRAFELFMSHKQISNAIAVSSAIATNWIALHNIDAAHQELAETLALVTSHLSITKPWSPIGLPGHSTAPFGYDTGHNNNETIYLRNGLKAALATMSADWPQTIELLRRNITARAQHFIARGDGELNRETIWLHNRLALAALRLRQDERFFHHTEQAISIAQTLQQDPDSKRYRPNNDTFHLEVGLALNGAQQLLTQLSHGQKAPSATVRNKLNQNHRHLAQLFAYISVPGKSKLLEERLKLALQLTLAQIKLWDAQLNAATSVSQPAVVSKALDSVFQRSAPYAEAVRLAKSVWKQTSRFQADTPNDRLLWHVQSGLVLADIASSATPTNQLPQHTTTTLIESLAELARKFEVGPWKYVIASELAYRRQSVQAMGAAVDGFLGTSPWLNRHMDIHSINSVRRRIFQRAIALATAHRDLVLVLKWTEQAERRAFADNLAHTPVRGVDLARQPLRHTIAAADRYTNHLKQQLPGASPPIHEKWRDALGMRQRDVASALDQLRAQSPRIAALFEVPQFPLDAIRAALYPGDVVIAALPVGDTCWLAHMKKDQSVQFERTDRVQLKSALQRLVRDARHAYLDLGRCYSGMDVERVALGLSKTYSYLNTWWSLLDAQAAKKLNFGAPPLYASKRVSQRDYEASSLIVLPNGMVHRGGTSTNLYIPDRDTTFAQQLGAAMQARLLVLSQTPSAIRLDREAAVAQSRLIYATGIASYITHTQPSNRNEAVKIPAAFSKTKHWDLWRLAKQLNGTLYGLAAGDAGSEFAWAKNQLSVAVAAGAKAFDKRQLADAIPQLKMALQLSNYLNEPKYLDGILLYVANAYTLLEDYDRGVPAMQQLVAYRAAQIQRSTDDQAKLKAQAKWGAALQSLAWLYFRAKRYNEALANNQQALDLYRQVNRPQLAGPLHEQRSIISEEAGDAKNALHHAKRWLDLSTDKATSASAHLRIAQLYRQYEFNYDKARTAAQSSLSLSAQPIEPLLELCRIETAAANYALAVKHAQSALSLAQQAKLVASIDTAHLELVNNFYYLGDFSQALTLSQKARNAAANNPRRQLQFLNAEGTIYAAMGRNDHAIDALKQAESIAQQLDLETELSASWNNIGNAFRLAGQYGQARYYFGRALQLDQKRNDRLALAFDHANLGLTESAAGNTRSAQQQLQSAIQISRAIGARLNELKALAELSRLALRGTFSAQGLVSAQAWAEQGQKLSRQLALPQWQWRFDYLLGRIFEQTNRIAAAQQAYIRAAELVEKLPIQPSQQTPQTSDPETPEHTYMYLIANLARQNQTLPALQWAHRARGYKTRRWSQTTLSGNTAEASRQEDTLIYFYPTDQRVVIWTTTAEKTTMTTSPWSLKELSSAVDQFRNAVQFVHPVHTITTLFYQKLFRPIKNLLPKNTRRLWLITDGPLQLIPFAALHDGHRYIGQTYELAHVSAISPSSFSQPAPDPKNQLFLTISRARENETSDTSLVQRESQYVTQTFKNTHWLNGAHATRTAWQALSPQAAYIHIATHSAYRSDAPLDTALEFSDQPLRIADLSPGSLTAKLVVLSACETGVGNLHNADNSVTFHRAFLSAGAQQVISTLWRISDLGAALVMKYFTRHLAGGESPTRALHLAQKQVQAHHPHPAFWAGFQIHH